MPTSDLEAGESKSNGGNPHGHPSEIFPTLMPTDSSAARNEKLENDYAAGQAALRAQQWMRAIAAFESVVAVDRNYRDARKRLIEAQNGLERETTNSLVARYYVEGVTARNRGDLNAALMALKKAHRLNPAYRDVAGLIAEIENKLQQQPPAGFAPSVQDSLYQIGLAAFNRGDWVQAVIAFEKTQLLQPGYRGVAERLAQARVRLEKNSSSSSRAKNSSGFFFFGGILAVLIVVPLAGAFILSPAARARLHLLRGDYAAATKVYENHLARHPERLKFYPVLADLYLLQGRRDEHAMKIYKAILHFDLATPHREELSLIVAQKYLTEGRTDSDAIEVLEHALQVEQRRQLHE
ncbi:MAG: tetratricopeptide repeat protein [candidate division KSB1 bacterium]|nr:tetratricopeptide repeat protein [candidate division KSB1 bacterium]MDZ7369132.1 tetratricopeptide repeat protein [candidate division KSB1 bacterium]MDZ7407105.1 tetratricopeptide repeat protein [candidate division KSB1 bacterium]